MRVFLFLYPITHYVEEEYNLYRRWGITLEEVVARLNQLIDIRYRQQGYRVVWLLFSLPRDKRKPNMSELSPLVQVKDEDDVISAGVPFCNHIEYFQYPDPRFVLTQLPQPVAELKLGGFHKDDCVARVGNEAFAQGIPVLVDDHLTNEFYIRMHRGECIPDQCEFSWDGFGFEPRVREMLPYSRSDKPWLAQS